MSKALVIDVYRFCSLVHELVQHNAQRIFVTNNRFLIRGYKDQHPDVVTFGESQGIKLPWTDYDTNPQDAPFALGKTCMVRSSLGARRVEQALHDYDSVYLCCMYNYRVYRGVEFARVYADDGMDYYCASLLRGASRVWEYEEILKATARDRTTAEVCWDRARESRMRLRVEPNCEGLLEVHHALA